MSALRVTLFGKWDIRSDTLSAGSIEGRRAQELFCYLLLNRDRPQWREGLADLLYSDGSSNPGKVLRQALWQLHHELDSRYGTSFEQLLVVEPEWIHVNPTAELWLDTEVFERSFNHCRDFTGEELDSERVTELEEAAELYGGDLLSGWSHEWCLYERERLKDIFLVILDKLMAYCEAHRKYELGPSYGDRALLVEPARERTYRRLMRLHYLGGDRTAALRKYARCVAVLSAELDVAPAQRTVALYNAIQAGQLETPPTRALATINGTAPPERLTKLREVRLFLRAMLEELEQGITSLESSRATTEVRGGSAHAGPAPHEPTAASQPSDG